MTMVKTGTGLYLPSYMAGGGLQLRSYTLDADGEYAAAVFHIPKTGTLKKIAVRVAAVTQADPINVRLETVDADTGYPSGTLYAAGSYGTISSPSANTTYWVELNGATGIRVTAQDIIAIKCILDFNDGNLQIASNVFWAYYSAIPCTVNYLGGTFAKAYESFNFGLEYDGEIISVPYSMPAILASGTSFNTLNKKIGLCFQVPFACTICAVALKIEDDYGNQVILYDSDQATPVQTWTLNPNLRGSSGQGFYVLPLTASKKLTPYTKYRLVLNNTTGSALYYYSITVTDDGLLSTMESITPGANWYYTECKNTPTGEESWTETITIRPQFGILIDQIETLGGLPILGGSIVK